MKSHAIIAIVSLSVNSHKATFTLSKSERETDIPFSLGNQMCSSYRVAAEIKSFSRALLLNVDKP